MENNIKRFLESLNGKTVALCGIGRSNLPLIQLFAQKGAKVMALDKKDEASLGENGVLAKQYGATLITGDSYLDKARENFPDFDYRLNIDLPDDFTILSNHHYLLLSIRELLYNAVNYSTGGYAWLRVTEYLSKIRFIVQDEGPGIPKEESDRMFEMFAKGNDLSEGLGLGLALTKRHIQNLGGTVFLDESYTDGCRMIIELPKVK